MKRFASVLSVVALFASLAWGSTAFILWGEEQERKREEEKERAFWAQSSFFFKPQSCSDGREGDDCAILLTPGLGSYLAFPHLQRVYVEGYLGVFEQKPVKLVVQHGKRGQKHKNIPPGYKLVACFCDQPECLIRTPDNPIGVTHNTLYQGLVFTKENPE